MAVFQLAQQGVGQRQPAHQHCPAHSGQHEPPGSRPMPPPLQSQRQPKQHSRPNERLREDGENFKKVKQDLNQLKAGLYL
jgi:hypothetical protein